MSIIIKFNPLSSDPPTYSISREAIEINNDNGQEWVKKSHLVRFLCQKRGLHFEQILLLSRKSRDERWIQLKDGVIEAEEVDLEDLLVHKFSYLTPQIRELVEAIQSMAALSVDLSTLREVSHRTSQVSPQVHIRNIADNSLEVEKEDEEMILFALLPNDAGVEMRGKYSYQYEAASPAQINEVLTARNKREIDLEHCKKLLKDLPQALERSQQETVTESSKEDPDIHRIGCMTIEQRRIEKEIAVQKAQFNQLEALVPQFDISKFITYSHRSRIEMPFGLCRVDDQIYEVLPVKDCIDKPLLKLSNP